MTETFSPEGQKRGPGRPAKESRAEQTQRQRRRRQDLGDSRNLKLFIPDTAKDDNYEYRWINDTTEGRVIQKTRYDDWDVVSEQDLKGYEGSEKDTGEGTPVKRIVGQAGDKPLYAFLCRKPREFHKEDKAKEQAAIDRMEADMRRGPVANPGGLKPSESYVPGGTNTIRHGGA